MAKKQLQLRLGIRLERPIEPGAFSMKAFEISSSQHFPRRADVHSSPTLLRFGFNKAFDQKTGNDAFIKDISNPKASPVDLTLDTEAMKRTLVEHELGHLFLYWLLGSELERFETSHNGAEGAVYGSIAPSSGKQDPLGITCQNDMDKVLYYLLRNMLITAAGAGFTPESPHRYSIAHIDASRLRSSFLQFSEFTAKRGYNPFSGRKEIPGYGEAIWHTDLAQALQALNVDLRRQLRVQLGTAEYDKLVERLGNTPDLHKEELEELTRSAFGRLERKPLLQAVRRVMRKWLPDTVSFNQK